MNKSIGDRIRVFREFRDVTQEQLAARSGVSVDTIRKLEQGIRQSARITTLRALARALDVQLERLLGQPTVTHQLTEDGGLIALRDAIQDIDALPGVPLDGDPEAPPTADAWVSSIRHATGQYWSGDYSELSSTLPMLLRDGRAVARETPTERVWQQLALAYQIAASLATQAGHPDWAFGAVEKQLTAAQRASDPLAEGMGVSTLSWVLLRQGRWEQAQAVAEKKADDLEPSFRRGSAEHLAVYGNLLVAAATAGRATRPARRGAAPTDYRRVCGHPIGERPRLRQRLLRRRCPHPEGQHCFGRDGEPSREGPPHGPRGRPRQHQPPGPLRLASRRRCPGQVSDRRP